MKQCKRCNKNFTLKPGQNSAKYCPICRPEAMKYTEYRTNWQRQKRDREATSPTTPPKNKLACIICNRYYKRPICHARQVHAINKRAYKSTAGLDNKKGIITPEAKQVLQSYVKDNYNVVVTQNLLKHGKSSRYTPGDKCAGVYERSAQTLARLSCPHTVKLKTYNGYKCPECNSHFNS